MVKVEGGVCVCVCVCVTVTVPPSGGGKRKCVCVCVCVTGKRQTLNLIKELPPHVRNEPRSKFNYNLLS